MEKFRLLIFFGLFFLGVGLISALDVSFNQSLHSGDLNQDSKISRFELNNVIKLYRAGNYHCNSSLVVGSFGENYDPWVHGGLFVEGRGSHGNYNCVPHDSDYYPQDWKISLRELLRMIQLYNSDKYLMSFNSEDGFSPVLS